MSSGYGRPGPDVYIAAFTHAWIRLGMDTEQLHVEFLDLVRSTGAEHRRLLREQLLETFAGKPPDVIVAFQDAALDFVLKELPQLAPQAPVVAAATDAATETQNFAGRRIIQHRAAFDYVRTLDLALTFFPKTRHVLVAGGASDIDLAQRRLIEGLAPRWAGRLSFEYTTDLPMPRILERVAAQPDDAVVLLTPGGINRDAVGQQHTRDAVINSIGQAARVPVLRVVGAGLADYAVLGGVVFDNEGEGRRAAELVRELALGQRVLSEPLTTLPSRNVPMFNWAELQRWKVDLALLPKDAVVLGQPATLWQQHRAVVVTGAAALLVLSALVVVLAAQNQRRRTAEGLALDSERRWRLLVDNAPEAIAVYDLDLDRFIEVNQNAERLFGMGREDILSQSPRNFYDPVQPDGLPVADSVAQMQRLAERGERVHFKRAILNREGRRVLCEVDMLRLPAGDARLMRVSYVDITDREEAERAREQMLAAQAASEAKTEFLSRMSHELRTPLNAVCGFAQLLADSADPLTPTQQRHLTLLRDGAAHLQTLIDDVIDVAHIEAGRLHVNQQPVALDAAMASALALCAAAASRAGVHTEAVPSQPPLFVRADPTRLRQVLVNLVSNGIKYNRAGGRVSLSAQRDGDKVRIEVDDDGMGITPEQRRDLFIAYNRLGRERSAIGGTGIGLVLSKRLVELMDGRLWLDDSTAGHTRFCVELHQSEAVSALPAPRMPAAAAPSDVRGVVLYIEDHPVNQVLVQEALLGCTHIELLQAETGAEGVALARARRPDLVLLDMHLPDMDGPDVMAALRAEPALAGIPVVGLSASAMTEDVELAFAAGVSAYWTKPFDITRLRDDVCQLLTEAAARR